MWLAAGQIARRYPCEDVVYNDLAEKVKGELGYARISIEDAILEQLDQLWQVVDA